MPVAPLSSLASRSRVGGVLGTSTTVIVDVATLLTKQSVSKPRTSVTRSVSFGVALLLLKVTASIADWKSA